MLKLGKIDSVVCNLSARAISKYQSPLKCGDFPAYGTFKNDWYQSLETVLKKGFTDVFSSNHSLIAMRGYYIEGELLG